MSYACTGFPAGRVVRHCFALVWTFPRGGVQSARLSGLAEGGGALYDPKQYPLRQGRRLVPQNSRTPEVHSAMRRQKERSVFAAI